VQRQRPERARIAPGGDADDLARVQLRILIDGADVLEMGEHPIAVVGGRPEHAQFARFVPTGERVGQERLVGVVVEVAYEGCRYVVRDGGYAHVVSPWPATVRSSNHRPDYRGRPARPTGGRTTRTAGSGHEI